MKLFMQTDMEGVAGVQDIDNWCLTESKYYEQGKKFLTLEVNAAIEGFIEGGFTEIVINDAHGCGAIDIELFNPKAKLLRSWPCEFGPYTHWPFGIDDSYDALAFVGQHAKAGTEYSHLTHSNNHHYIDIRINNISIGEYGQMVLCAGEKGVPVIFASGEKALCDEALSLTPWVETVSVKQGTIAGDGNDLDCQSYMQFHLGAIHENPQKAGMLIRDKALKCARHFLCSSDDFKLLTLKKPYELWCKLRPSNGRLSQEFRLDHSDSISTLFNLMIDKVESLAI